MINRQITTKKNLYIMDILFDSKLESEIKKDIASKPNNIKGINEICKYLSLLL